MTFAIVILVIGGLFLYSGTNNMSVADALGTLFGRKPTKQLTSLGGLEESASQTEFVGTGGELSGGGAVQSGSYVFPLPQGTWRSGQLDEGWDISAPGHTPLFAIGSGKIVGHGISGFGPWAPILQLDSGGSVYYGHAGPGNWTPTGTHVNAGQVISEVGAGIVGISTGPHLEIGWYPPGSRSGASMKQALGY